MHYAKTKALFVSYTSSQSYNTFTDIQRTPNDGAQFSESTATTRLQPAPDSPVASICQKYWSNVNSTTQQHTPGLEFSTAVLSTSDISDTSQQQQHAAGLGMAASDFAVLSMSGISNNFQHTQEHASGFELSTSTSNNDSPTSDNLQRAQQHDLASSSVFLI